MGPKIIQILQLANKDVNITIIDTAYLGKLKKKANNEERCKI